MIEYGRKSRQDVEKIGGASRDRTDDLIVAKDGVCQFASMFMPLLEPITFQNVPFGLFQALKIQVCRKRCLTVFPAYIPPFAGPTVRFSFARPATWGCLDESEPSCHHGRAADARQRDQDCVIFCLIPCGERTNQSDPQALPFPGVDDACGSRLQDHSF